MKIGIYTPYLDTLGGGEKYIFDIAKTLCTDNEVHIFSKDKTILDKALERFNIDLSDVKILERMPFGLTQVKTGMEYDAFFYVSDGSIPFLSSRRNYLIIQFPVNWVKIGLKGSIKLTWINSIICYSDYVRSKLEKIFKKEILVIPPFVKSVLDEGVKKENIILSVGRFTKGMNEKKQELMIKEFLKLPEEIVRNWRLVLVGSYRKEDEEYFKKIDDSTRKHNIEVIGNASFKQISEYYNRAKIYWHAAGFQENLNLHPEKAEHFGITTVEAMSAGAVPVVIDAGGQKEIVTQGENGYLWKSSSDLAEYTLRLVEDESLLHKMSKKAIKRAEHYSGDNFKEKILKLVK